MRKLASLVLSLFLTAGTAFADSPKDTPKDSPKDAAAAPAKPAAANATTKTNAEIAAEMEELRQALQAQQEQLQMLKEELAKRDRQIEEAREAAATANSRATEASSKATEAAATSAEVKASTEVLKTTVESERADAQKMDEEGPSTIRYKGVTITPGGFLAAETVFRSRAISSDINTDFKSLPYPGLALSKLSENNFSGRQSRLSLLVGSKIGGATVNGYYEGDFLGAGTTSNNRQSNSYLFRQRQAWASVKFESGAYIAGGQMWSMVTESKKGIENRQEQFPLMIDPQYLVGWAWQRAYGFRVAQNWDKFAVGFSVEGPQTTIGGRGFAPNFFINAPGDAAGLYNSFDNSSTGGVTVNKSPDFMFKATWDPSAMAHLEVVGIVSPFRNRIYPCGAQPLVVADLPAACNGSLTSVAGAFNDSRTGGGVGGTGRLHLFSKKLDLAGHVQGGDGIGRYSSAQLVDVTARPDGTLAPIHSYAWLGTAELHPTPKFDVYAYLGGEYATRTAYTYTNAAGNSVATGYGSQLFNNAGCGTETAPTTTPIPAPPSGTGFPGGSGACAGDIHQIIEGTLGFWHKFYQGPKGRLQWGIQYSYLTKVGWSGDGLTGTAAGTVPATNVRPKAVDNMLFTSFRFYIP